MKIVFMIENGNVFETSYPEYHKNATKLTKAKGLALIKEQIKNNLLGRIKPKDTIYTTVLSVSSRGMSRKMKCFIVENDRIVDITGSVAKLLGYTWAKNGGVSVSGCGMDMGFHVVYSLGRTLWQDGTPESHGMRNGEPDFDGGYALKQSWL